MLVLPHEVRRDLETWIGGGYPDETCGLLVGRTHLGRTGDPRATRAKNLNQARARDRYDLDPADSSPRTSRAREAGSRSSASGIRIRIIRRALGDGPRRGLGGLVLRDRRGHERAASGRLRSWRLDASASSRNRSRAHEHRHDPDPDAAAELHKGADEVRVARANVQEALANLGEQCPGILDRILDKDGKVRSFVNVFVGSSNVRSLQGLVRRSRTAPCCRSSRPSREAER
jgi:hypothetical protein